VPCGPIAGDEELILTQRREGAESAKIMKLKVAITPDEKLAPVGSVLSVEQAAALLELNAADMRTRLEFGASALIMDGFRLEPVK
jgi:hypothetical protein